MVNGHLTNKLKIFNPVFFAVRIFVSFFHRTRVDNDLFKIGQIDSFVQG